MQRLIFCLITPKILLPGELSSSASLRGMDLELQTQVTLDSSPDACTGDLHQPAGAAEITHTSRLHVLSTSTSLILDLPLGLLHPQHPSLSLCWTRPDRLRLSRPASTPNVCLFLPFSIHHVSVTTGQPSCWSVPKARSEELPVAGGPDVNLSFLVWTERRTAGRLSAKRT